MKLVCVLVLGGALLASCGGSKPEPTRTPEPTIDVASITASANAAKSATAAASLLRIDGLVIHPKATQANDSATTQKCKDAPTAVLATALQAKGHEEFFDRWGNSKVSQGRCFTFAPTNMEDIGDEWMALLKSDGWDVTPVERQKGAQTYAFSAARKQGTEVTAIALQLTGTGIVAYVVVP